MARPFALAASSVHAVAVGAARFGMTAVDILLYLFVFCAILLLAYATSRFVGKRAQQGGGRGGRASHLSIVESVGLGADAQLVIVRAGGEYLLLSKSGKTVALLAKLDLDDAAVEAARQQSAGSPVGFFSILEKQIAKLKPELPEGAQDAKK